MDYSAQDLNVAFARGISV